MQDPNEDTEWNDVLRAKGIIPQKPQELEITEEQIVDMLEATIATKTNGRQLDDLNLDELDELEDDFLNDERFMQDYRLKRLREMKEQEAKTVFGSMREISQVDFVREVSEASKTHWIVVFLYKPGIPACKLLSNHLQLLANKYPETKFVSIIGDHCIPNYPDRNLPTILVYGQGELKRQQVGLVGLGGMSSRLEDVEMFLASVGAMNLSDRDKAALLSKLSSLFTSKDEEDGYDSD